MNNRWDHIQDEVFCPAGHAPLVSRHDIADAIVKGDRLYCPTCVRDFHITDGPDGPPLQSIWADERNRGLDTGFRERRWALPRWTGGPIPNSTAKRRSERNHNDS
jgi:uncharacterized protein YbaR (Trm112 family)